MRILTNHELERYGLDGDLDLDADGLWFYVRLAAANAAWTAKIRRLAEILGGGIAADFPRPCGGAHVFILRLPLACLAGPAEISQVVVDDSDSLFLRLPTQEALAEGQRRLGGPQICRLLLADFETLLDGRIAHVDSSYALLKTRAVVSRVARIAYDDLIAALAGRLLSTVATPQSEWLQSGPEFAEKPEEVFYTELQKPPVVDKVDFLPRSNGPMEHIVKFLMIVWGRLWDQVLLEAEDVLGMPVEWGASNEERLQYRMNQPLESEESGSGN